MVDPHHPAQSPAEQVAGCIISLRGQRVILDADLARIYGVETRRLNEAVRRNLERFPSDFSFIVNRKELVTLMSQFATSNAGRGGRRKLPRAFTEHGAIMVATLLNSPRAVQLSVFVVRAFVRMREALASHQELAAKLAELERTLTARLDSHEKAILHLLDELKQWMAPPPATKKEIGFHVRERGAAYRARVRR